MSPEPRKLRRRPDGAMVAGVCSGLGRYLNIDRDLIRIAVVVLTILTSGLGALAYGFAWIVLPMAESPVAGESAGSGGSSMRGRGSWAFGFGAGLITLGLLFILREAGVWWSDALVWPLVLAAGGAALLWRQFTGPARAGNHPRSRSRTPDPAAYRIVFGLALVMGAGLLFLYVNGALEGGGDAALAVVTVIVVLGLVLAPLWVRLGRRLGDERAARIRSQERAEVAAHLHDSVLQTLAMVQKHSDDPREVSTLARRQERELRDWLSGKSGEERERSLAGALEAVAAEVEEQHGVAIEAVTVGDRPLDERGLATVGAAREAMVNAVRYAGDDGPVRMFAEITSKSTQVFVRDRGPGFELDRVPDDRRGVRDSILGRMERSGGQARVRSGPGEGTEVELRMETK
jgi:phage shock protein PspC (stress-responsive transcriptional regulator)/signal transduction histidine kinase